MFHFHIIIFKCCSDTTSTSTSYVRSWLQHSEVFGGKPKTKLRQSNSTTTKECYGIVLGSSGTVCVLHAPRMLCQHKKPLPLSLSQPLLHNKNCYLQAFPLKLWEYNLMTWRKENVDLFGLLNTFALLQWMRIFAKQRLDSTTFSFAAFVSSETMSAYRSPNRPKQVTH